MNTKSDALSAMRINVVNDYPSEHPGRRILSALMRLLGALLLTTGLLAAVPVLFFLIIEIGSFIARDASPFDWEGVKIYVVIAIIMIACLLLGRRLLRGRRRLVLFLRRFGFVGATEALTFALANAIGHSWRLITLDDQKVAAVGTGRRIRWTTIAGFISSILIPAGLLLWLIYFGDGISEGSHSSANSIEGLINLFVAIIVAFIIFFIAMLLALLFVLLGMFSLGSYISVRRAERSKRIAVASADQIDPISRSIARRARRVISPKLVVIRVADAVWKDTVRRLASFSVAIVIDVSEPTPNLLWEVSTLKQELRLHWILVAERQRLSDWTNATGIDLNQKLLALLEGESVLAYTPEPADRKRFARALRNRLDSLSGSDNRSDLQYTSPGNG